MVGGPIAVTYHLEGVDGLVLDADTLAKIFDSKITKWNDPAIKKLNPDAKLPGKKIQAFHRSDESGTTDNFTKYLNTAAPSSWKHEPEKAWAGKGGQGADGSSGIATNVKQNDGSIGYAELSYATGNDLNTVKLDTGAEEPVDATADNASKAIADAKVVGPGQGPLPGAELQDRVRGRLPDRPGDVRDRLRQGQQEGVAGRDEVLPQVHRERGRPEGTQGEGLRPDPRRDRHQGPLDHRRPELSRSRHQGGTPTVWTGGAPRTAVRSPPQTRALNITKVPITGVRTIRCTAKGPRRAATHARAQRPAPSDRRDHDYRNPSRDSGLREGRHTQG